jgi:hypothetical protein
VTTPHAYKAGASGMTQVCRPTPTVRFMHRSETSSKQLLYRMARLVNSVAFIPLALGQRTHRNAMLLKTCKRTTSPFFLSYEKWKRCSARLGSAAFIPRRERRGLSPRFGKAYCDYFMIV